MTHHQILVIGGGAAGITAAAQLRRARPSLDIAILEPASEHWYQPGWTLVSGGVFSLDETRRAERDLIPSGVTWIQAAARGLDPDRNQVTTSDGQPPRQWRRLCRGGPVQPAARALPERVFAG